MSKSGPAQRPVINYTELYQTNDQLQTLTKGPIVYCAYDLC